MLLFPATGWGSSQGDRSTTKLMTIYLLDLVTDCSRVVDMPHIIICFFNNYLKNATCYFGVNTSCFFKEKNCFYSNSFDEQATLIFTYTLNWHY